MPCGFSESKIASWLRLKGVTSLRTCMSPPLLSRTLPVSAVVDHVADQLERDDGHDADGDTEDRQQRALAAPPSATAWRSSSRA